MGEPQEPTRQDSNATTILVLGKPSIHKIEYDSLYAIGRAIAIRNKILRTTQTKGACRAVVEGYEAEKGVVQYITKDMNPTEGVAGVLVFTDAKYQAKLDERLPDWRNEDWIVFHNRKATTEAHNMIKQILDDLGTPL